MPRSSRYGMSCLKVTCRGCRRHLVVTLLVFLFLYSLNYIAQYSFLDSQDGTRAKRSNEKHVLYFRHGVANDVTHDVTKPLSRAESSIPTWGNLTGLQDHMEPMLRGHYQVLERRGSKLPLPWLVPDVKSSPCKVQDLTTDLRATLIVHVHGSRIDQSLTSLFSILKHTNVDRVEDVILIGDIGLPGLYREIYELFPDYLPTFRFFLTPKRTTGTQARKYAARFAHGDVLVFIHSRVQVTSHWLDNIMAALLKNPRKIVEPVVINSDTNFDSNGLPVSVQKRELQLDLTLREIATPVSEHYFSKGFQTESILSGPVFAITKQHYRDIRDLEEYSGFLDLELIVFSLKAWMCGDGIISTPCSFVYIHQHSVIPVSSNLTAVVAPSSKTLEIKHKRHLMFISSVWLPPYEEVYKCLLPRSKNIRLSYTEKRSIKYYKQFYGRLHCKQFNYYVKQAQPNLFKPKANALFHGTLNLVGTDLYLSRSSNGSGLVLVDYLPVNSHPFTYANSSIIINNVCVTYSPNTHIILSQCQPRVMNQKWHYKNGQFQLKRNPHLCIVKAEDSDIPSVNLCTNEKVLSRFNFTLSFEGNCIR